MTSHGLSGLVITIVGLVSLRRWGASVEGEESAWKDGRVSEWAWHQRPSFEHGVRLPTTRPLNIAHRGSTGTYPEHTLPSYRAGIADGADVIECDVGLTKDLVPVCIHESWLGGVTDAAETFPDRLTTHSVHGVPDPIQDIFSVDLTLTELKTLKTKQRFRFRDHRYDGKFGIPTLEEFIAVAKNANRPVGIYPEIKNPEWVNTLDIVKDARTTFEDIVLQILAKNGYSKKTDPCFLQSFSETSIQYLSNITELPLVQLIDSQEFEIIPDSSLERWAKTCYGIGVWKRVLVDDTNKTISHVTDLVGRAHARDLRVHGYTFRNEDQYLAFDYQQDPYAEYALFVSLGLDGFFSDFPGTFNRYLEGTYAVSCPEIDVFCVKCLQLYAREVVYGQARPPLTCMTADCDVIFPYSQIKKALSGDDLANYEERMQEEEMLMAGILKEMVRCPQCNFPAIPDRDLLMFDCPECKHQSCVKCKEDWTTHAGVTCEQLKNDKRSTNVRVTYEEQMTLIAVRTCATCGARFTKQEGCNHMMCRCGSEMCYICRAPVAGYSHFCAHACTPRQRLQQVFQV